MLPSQGGIASGILLLYAKWWSLVERRSTDFHGLLISRGFLLALRVVYAPINGDIVK